MNGEPQMSAFTSATVIAPSARGAAPAATCVARCRSVPGSIASTASQTAAAAGAMLGRTRSATPENTPAAARAPVPGRHNQTSAHAQSAATGRSLIVSVA